MKTLIIASVVIILALPSPSIDQSQAQSSVDLFKSGRIRLIEEIRVSDKDLPESALFQNPRAVAVDARGSVYVSDFEANHIKVFGPDGTFRTTIGRQGQGPGDLSGPSNIEISGERIVVWEAMNRRFSILDMKGGLIKTAKPIHGGWGDLMAIRALPDGRLAAFIEKGLPDQTQV
jgi:DNA-binding beta-propeller fold protein YncE